MLGALVALAPVLAPYVAAMVTVAGSAAAWIIGQAVGGSIADNLSNARQQRTLVLSVLPDSTFQSLAKLTPLQSSTLGSTMNGQISANVISQLAAMVNATPLVQTEIDKAKAVLLGYYQDGLIDALFYNASLNQLDLKASALAPVAAVVTTAAAVPGANWSIGQTLKLSSGELWQILDVWNTGTDVCYTAKWLATGNIANITQTTLLAAQAAVYTGTQVTTTAAVTTTTPGTTVETPAPAATAQGGTIVNVAPQIKVDVPPTVVTVNTPAPIVNTENKVNVDTSALGAALPLVGTALVTALATAAQDIGCGLNRGVVGCQATTGASLLGTIMKGIAPLGMMLFLENPQISERFTDPITRAMFDQLLTIPELGKPVQPGDAPTLARKLFERAVGLGIGAHIAAQVSEASTPMKTLGMGYVAAFLADLAGFSRIAAATMGVLETQALQVPMKYYINQHVRSILPDPRALDQLAAHHVLGGPGTFDELTQTDEGLDQLRVLNKAKYVELLAYQGIAPEFEDGYFDVTERPPAPRLLQQMADAGIYDPVYFRRVCLKSGYDLASVRNIVSMLYTRAHGELKAQFTSSAISRYKQGLDSVEQLQTNLTMLGVRPELMGKYVTAAQFSEDLDSFTDYVAVLKAAVEKGALDPDDMKSLLVNRGMRADRADLLAQLEAIKLLPKKKATSVTATTTP
jgi:hypothetical protein